MNDMLKTNSQVWTNNNHRALATQTFISIGVNLILVYDDVNKGALDIAKTILILEHYDSSEGPGLSSSLYSRPVASKMRDIENGTISIKRDLLKFYRKRISACKCLKQVHLETRKTVPKTSQCYHCGKETERVLLSLCGRCMIDQYCSRECQVAAWPEHKRNCDMYVQVGLAIK